MESSLEFSGSLGSSFSSTRSRCRTFKVVVIGDSGVGKTCLTHRLCAGEFPRRVEATIGVDFRERLLDVDGENIKVTAAPGLASRQTNAAQFSLRLVRKSAPTFYAWRRFHRVLLEAFRNQLVNKSTRETRFLLRFESGPMCFGLGLTGTPACCHIAAAAAAQYLETGSCGWGFFIIFFSLLLLR